MKENLIRQAYEIAKERYAAIGVDVDKPWIPYKDIIILTLLASR